MGEGSVLFPVVLLTVIGHSLALAPATRAAPRRRPEDAGHASCTVGSVMATREALLTADEEGVPQSADRSANNMVRFALGVTRGASSATSVDDVIVGAAEAVFPQSPNAGANNVVHLGATRGASSASSVGDVLVVDDEGLLAQSGNSNANMARLALGVVAATYGTNYACVKLLDEWVGSPSIAAALRFSVACAAMMPALGYLGVKVDPKYTSWPIARDGLVTGFYFFLGYAVQATALETSAASLQAFLLSLSVVVCPLLERFADGKRQPMRAWLAAGLATLGVAALELDGATDALAGLSEGDMLGLLQPVFFGVGFWEMEHAMTRHRPTGDAVGSSWALPVALTAWQLIAVLGLSLVWMVTSDPAALAALWTCLQTIASEPQEHAAMLGTIAWTGVGTTAGCALVEAAALGELSSSEATVVFATEPLWGAAFAFLLLGEVMGPQCMMGGALMVFACLVSGVELPAAAPHVPSDQPDSFRE